MVFTGNANPELAKKVAQYLDIPMGIAAVSVFSDGEISVEIGENVRGTSLSRSLKSICCLFKCSKVLYKYSLIVWSSSFSLK